MAGRILRDPLHHCVQHAALRARGVGRALLKRSPREVAGDEVWSIVKPADEELEGVDEAGAGAVEHLVAIDDGDAPALHGGEVGPPGLLGEFAGASEGLGEGKAARGDDEAFRLGADEFFGGDDVGGRCDAGAALRAEGGSGIGEGGGHVPGVAGAGAFQELDGPVAGAEEGVGPLEEADDGAVFIGIDEILGPEEAFSQGDHGPIAGGAPIGAEGVGDPEEIIQNILDGRWIEREHPGWTGEGARQTLNRRKIDGADVAEVLGQNEIGLERGQQGLVHCVQGFARGERFPDGLVDSARVGGGIDGSGGVDVGSDPGGGQDGAGRDLGWEVTFM